MSRLDKYPRIGEKRSIDKGLCSCCPEKASHRVDVQTSYMRGDDDVFKLCSDHLKLLESGSYDEIYSDAEETKQLRRTQLPEKRE